MYNTFVYYYAVKELTSTMRIGPRIIKTAIAATGAMWIAGLLSLDFAVSAGILAVLGVQVTRKRTVENVTARFLACLIGLAFAYALFAVFTFHPVVVGVLLVFLLAFLARVRLQEGIVTSIVVVLHVYRAEELSLTLLWGEILVIVIGLGTSLVVNLSYMPSVKNEVTEISSSIDELLSKIFVHYGNFLTQEDYIWDGKEIILLEEKLSVGKGLALRSLENYWAYQEDDFYRFIRMREKQFDWIKRMMILVSRIHHPLEQSYLLAPLFYALSEQVKARDYSGKILDDLYQLNNEVEKMDLPHTREEFEIRASLYHLLHELEQFIMIAKKEKHFQASEKATTWNHHT
jgi:uncharacterized membrane protein YgaE (UPF0421/DUF939 family)